MKVFDKDALAIDDLLGTARIEWQDCFNNPSNDERGGRYIPDDMFLIAMWRLNEVVALTGDSSMG